MILEAETLSASLAYYIICVMKLLSLKNKLSGIVPCVNMLVIF